MSQEQLQPNLKNTYDAIVVGARIAGAATALLLAQQGARVLLLDRATFPAPTVSCPVFFGNSLAMLERLGVLDVVEAIDAPKIRLYGLRTPDFSIVTHLPSSGGHDYAYSIRREVFDTAILERVRTHSNITLREGFNVSDVIWSMGQVVGVRGRQNGGPEESLYARIVVGADGKRSKIAQLVDAKIYDRQKSETAIFYAYYRHFASSGEPSAIAYGDPRNHQSVLVFDADAGLTVVSVGVPAAEFDEARKDPEATVERVWRAIPELAERGRHAVRETKVMGQAPFDSFYRQPYGPGWALVGDAGHYIDPITGQGINHALRSAELFAEAWSRMQRHSTWQRAMAAYHRKRDAETRPMYNFIAVGEQMQQIPPEVGMFIGTLVFRAIARQPDVSRRYVGMFNGATSIESFTHPLNLTRIVIQDGLQNELPRLAGSFIGARVTTSPSL